MRWRPRWARMSWKRGLRREGTRRDPGLAFRLASGGRTFAKALGVDPHSSSVWLYRNEAIAMPHPLPDLPVLRLFESAAFQPAYRAVAREQVPDAYDNVLGEILAGGLRGRGRG